MVERRGEKENIKKLRGNYGLKCTSIESSFDDKEISLQHYRWLAFISVYSFREFLANEEMSEGLTRDSLEPLGLFLIY